MASHEKLSQPTVAERKLITAFVNVMDFFRRLMYLRCVINTMLPFGGRIGLPVYRLASETTTATTTTTTTAAAAGSSSPTPQVQQSVVDSTPPFAMISDRWPSGMYSLYQHCSIIETEVKPMKKFSLKVAEREFFTDCTAVRVTEQCFYNYALILCLDAGLKMGPILHSKRTVIFIALNWKH